MIKIGKNISSFSTYSCVPHNREELAAIIDERISKDGLSCDLNDIDTSLITDMSGLFIGTLFNGDISGWEYFGSTLGGAIGGLGAGLGTTILASGVGNVIESAFAGDISSFGDVMIQFALGGVLGGVGYGISKGITSIFADKKIFGILGNLSDNAKVNKRLAKAGFGYLKIGKHGFTAVYDELYKKLGYGIVEQSINSSYDFVVVLVF